MGCSFHWTNREKLLAKLDEVIIPSGAVALIDPKPGIWSSEGPTWALVAREVVRNFLGPERRAGTGIYRHSQRRHEEVLHKSPFSMVTTNKFSQHYQLSIEQICGLMLSTSFSSPCQLGDQLPAFRATLRAKLSKISPSGHFGFDQNFELIIGKRP